MTGGVPMSTVMVPGDVLQTGPPLAGGSVSQALNWKVNVSATADVLVMLTTPLVPT